MAEFTRQQSREGDDIECDNCGTPAPVAWFDIGPPYSQDNPPGTQHALCRYCANSTEGASVCVNMARMFNELEQALAESHSRNG